VGHEEVPGHGLLKNVSSDAISTGPNAPHGSACELAERLEVGAHLLAVAREPKRNFPSTPAVGFLEVDLRAGGDDTGRVWFALGHPRVRPWR
jgi:hypothetical protein